MCVHAHARERKTKAPPQRAALRAARTCARPPIVAPPPRAAHPRRLAVQNCEPRIEPPPDRRVSAGLRAVISALLTRDASARMTLNQLRRHPWLSKEGRAPLIEQPGGFVQVSSADVAQAITQPMQVSGHAGALEREGSTSIVKHSIHAEYSFYVKVAASEIAAYVPILYGLKQERAPRASRRSSILSAGGEGGGDDSPLQLWMSRRGSVDADAQRAQPGDECQFVMQDLTAGMRFPCVMDIKMGTHTTLQLDESDRTPRADLLKKMVRAHGRRGGEVEECAGQLGVCARG
jgi:serine/threonine protein kinase